jgi:hypothetical protein
MMVKVVMGNFNDENSIEIVDLNTTDLYQKKTMFYWYSPILILMIFFQKIVVFYGFTLDIIPHELFKSASSRSSASLRSATHH